MNMPAPIERPLVYSKPQLAKPRFHMHTDAMVWVECESKTPLMILTAKTPLPILMCLFDNERHLNG